MRIRLKRDLTLPRIATARERRCMGVYLCTGFDGDFDQYTENWRRKQMEKAGEQI